MNIVLVVYGIPILSGLLIVSAVVLMFVRPRGCLLWFASVVLILIGFCCGLWFGLRHDVSTAESFESALSVVVVITLLVAIGKRSARLDDGDNPQLSRRT